MYTDNHMQRAERLSCTDGGGNTYRSGGYVCATDAGAVHAHITTAPVGVSPSISAA